MSYADCIKQNPALSDKRRQELINEYDNLVDRYKQTMGDINSAHIAAKKFVELKEKTLIKKMNNTVRDVLAWEDLNKNLDDIAAKFQLEKDNALFGKFLWGNTTGMAVRRKLEDVNTAQLALEERSYRALSDLLEKYRSKAGGLIQDTEEFKSVIDEVLGKDTGNAAAKADAKAIREVFDLLHKQYENAGGILGKLDNYFPQRHNTKRVGASTKDEWKSYVVPLLDKDKMINPDSGLPYTDSELNDALDDVYEKIRTNGLSELSERVEEGKQTFGRPSSVALRHNSSRFLHFKDADSFHKYNQKFGDGDENLFDAMLGHIHAMTRDIALMQELGPNPDGQIKRMLLKIQESGATLTAQNTAQGMFDVVAGRTSYTGAEPESHRYIRDAQNWMRSAYLGSAPVSAMSDSFYAAAAAKYNGLPATKVIKEYFKYLNPVDSADRQIARRNAFVSGAVSGMSIRGARFADDMGGAHRWSTFMANFTHRMSGLGIMTDAVRSAPVLATHGFMADAALRGTKFSELPIEMQEAFARWDMDEVDFNNIIKSKPFVEPEFGGDFIRPEDVAASGYLETAVKYDKWLQDMAQVSSNEPRLLTRYIITGLGSKQGTFRRLGASTVSMFKSFGLTVMINHTLPALRYAAQGRIGRIAAMATVLPLLGGMAIQSRNVLYGKTPQDMDKASFWAASLVQGGGFGILGDFFFADYSRYNQSIGSTLLGPGFGLADNLARATLGNLYKAIDEDKESNFVRDMTKIATQNIPMIKLWYTRLFMERLVLDQLERMSDPGYDARIRRVERKMQKEKGQNFYWRPGTL